MQKLWPNAKIIKAIKRDKDYFYVTQKQVDAIELARKLKDDMIKIEDADTKQLLFWGKPADIIEYKEDLTQINTKARSEEEKAQDGWIKAYRENEKKKKAWSIEKMKEPWMKEMYEECLLAAREKLDEALKKEYIWEKFLKRYSLCVWRKMNSCPYS